MVRGTFFCKVTQNVVPTLKLPKGPESLCPDLIGTSANKHSIAILVSVFPRIFILCRLFWITIVIVLNLCRHSCIALLKQNRNNSFNSDCYILIASSTLIF